MKQIGSSQPLARGLAEGCRIGRGAAPVLQIDQGSSQRPTWRTRISDVAFLHLKHRLEVRQTDCPAQTISVRVTRQ